MEIKWHGTASIELKNQTGRILFDPFVPLKGSNVKVAIEDFDGFTDIFVTHGHFDHIVNLPEICGRNPSVRIYCTRAPYKTLLKKGVPGGNLILIDYGRTIEINGFKITAIHGKHARLIKATPKKVSYYLRSECRYNIPILVKGVRDYREKDETVFYLVEAEDKRVELMGSLNLRDGCDYPTGCDALVLPYNGWKDNFPPAVGVIEKLRPKHVYLDHFDVTFPPFTEPLDLTPVLEKYGDRIEALALNNVVEV